jgi:4-nitrophenyl phosphatase
MVKGVILDLDGTVYLGQAEVPGAARFLALLRRNGVRFLFVTNRANRTPEEIRTHLDGLGIACDAADVLTSAEATAAFLAPGSVYVIGEEGLRTALAAHGHRPTEQSPDYVVVSYDRGFNFDKLTTATRLILNGARYVATNPDRGLRTTEGVTPGTGSIVAAVSAATGREPLVIGKPQRLIMDMAVKRLGLPPAEVIAIGDNLETDVPAGARAGLRTVLILTGISTRAELATADSEPTWTVESYGELEEILARELAP